MLHSVLLAFSVILAMSILLALALALAEKSGKTPYCQGRDHCGSGGCAGCSEILFCDEYSQEERSDTVDPVSRIEGEHHYGTR